MITAIAITILVIFDLYALYEFWRHEQAICELLRIHPELLEEDNNDKPKQSA